MALNKRQRYKFGMIALGIVAFVVGLSLFIDSFMERGRDVISIVNAGASYPGAPTTSTGKTWTIKQQQKIVKTTNVYNYNNVLQTSNPQTYYYDTYTTVEPDSTSTTGTGTSKVTTKITYTSGFVCVDETGKEITNYNDNINLIGGNLYRISIKGGAGQNGGEGGHNSKRNGSGGGGLVINTDYVPTDGVKITAFIGSFLENSNFNGGNGGVGGSTSGNRIGGDGGMGGAASGIYFSDIQGNPNKGSFLVVAGGGGGGGGSPDPVVVITENEGGDSHGGDCTLGISTSTRYGGSGINAGQNVTGGGGGTITDAGPGGVGSRNGSAGTGKNGGKGATDGSSSNNSVNCAAGGGGGGGGGLTSGYGGGGGGAHATGNSKRDAGGGGGGSSGASYCDLNLLSAPDPDVALNKNNSLASITITEYYYGAQVNVNNNVIGNDMSLKPDSTVGDLVIADDKNGNVQTVQYGSGNVRNVFPVFTRPLAFSDMVITCEGYTLDYFTVEGMIGFNWGSGNLSTTDNSILVSEYNILKAAGGGNNIALNLTAHWKKDELTVNIYNTYNDKTSQGGIVDYQYGESHKLENNNTDAVSGQDYFSYGDTIDFQAALNFAKTITEFNCTGYDIDGFWVGDINEGSTGNQYYWGGSQYAEDMKFVNGSSINLKVGMKLSFVDGDNPQIIGPISGEYPNGSATVNIYIHWEPHTYNVTYYDENGEIYDNTNTINITSYTYDRSNSLPTASDMDIVGKSGDGEGNGWTFGGWYLSYGAAQSHGGETQSPGNSNAKQTYFDVDGDVNHPHGNLSGDNGKYESFAFYAWWYQNTLTIYYANDNVGDDGKPTNNNGTTIASGYIYPDKAPNYSYLTKFVGEDNSGTIKDDGTISYETGLTLDFSDLDYEPTLNYRTFIGWQVYDYDNISNVGGDYSAKYNDGEKELIGFPGSVDYYKCNWLKYENLGVNGGLGKKSDGTYENDRTPITPNKKLVNDLCPNFRRDGSIRSTIDNSQLAYSNDGNGNYSIVLLPMWDSHVLEINFDKGANDGNKEPTVAHAPENLIINGQYLVDNSNASNTYNKTNAPVRFDSRYMDVNMSLFLRENDWKNIYFSCNGYTQEGWKLSTSDSTDSTVLSWDWQSDGKSITCFDFYTWGFSFLNDLTTTDYVSIKLEPIWNADQYHICYSGIIHGGDYSNGSDYQEPVIFGSDRQFLTNYNEDNFPKDVTYDSNGIKVYLPKKQGYNFLYWYYGFNDNDGIIGPSDEERVHLYSDEDCNDPIINLDDYEGEFCYISMGDLIGYETSDEFNNYYLYAFFEAQTYNIEYEDMQYLPDTRQRYDVNHIAPGNIGQFIDFHDFDSIVYDDNSNPIYGYLPDSASVSLKNKYVKISGGVWQEADFSGWTKTDDKYTWYNAKDADWVWGNGNNSSNSPKFATAMPDPGNFTVNSAPPTYTYDTKKTIPTPGINWMDGNPISPANPKPPSYRFEGWYSVPQADSTKYISQKSNDGSEQVITGELSTDGNNTAKWYSDDILSKNDENDGTIKLYAHWVADEYTISYSYGDIDTALIGSNPNNRDTYNEAILQDGAIYLYAPLGDWATNNYTFDYWLGYDSSDHPIYLFPEDGSVAGSVCLSPAISSGSDLMNYTFTAHWKNNKLNVTFVDIVSNATKGDDGTTITDYKTGNKIPGVGVTLRNSFGGDNSSYYEPKIDGRSIVVLNNTFFNAQFADDVNTQVVDDNVHTPYIDFGDIGGAYVESNNELDHGYYSKYSFVGWKWDAGGKMFDFARDENTGDTLRNDITLQAIWIPNRDPLVYVLGLLKAADTRNKVIRNYPEKLSDYDSLYGAAWAYCYDDFPSKYYNSNGSYRLNATYSVPDLTSNVNTIRDYMNRLKNFVISINLDLSSVEWVSGPELTKLINYDELLLEYQIYNGAGLLSPTLQTISYTYKSLNLKANQALSQIINDVEGVIKSKNPQSQDITNTEKAVEDFCYAMSLEYTSLSLWWTGSTTGDSTTGQVVWLPANSDEKKGFLDFMAILTEYDISSEANSYITTNIKQSLDNNLDEVTWFDIKGWESDLIDMTSKDIPFVNGQPQSHVLVLTSGDDQNRVNKIIEWSNILNEYITGPNPLPAGQLNDDIANYSADNYYSEIYNRLVNIDRNLTRFELYTYENVLKDLARQVSEIRNVDLGDDGMVKSRPIFDENIIKLKSYYNKLADIRNSGQVPAGTELSGLITLINEIDSLDVNVSYDVRGITNAIYRTEMLPSISYYIGSFSVTGDDDQVTKDTRIRLEGIIYILGYYNNIPTDLNSAISKANSDLNTSGLTQGTANSDINLINGLIPTAIPKDPVTKDPIMPGNAIPNSDSIFSLWRLLDILREKSDNINNNQFIKEKMNSLIADAEPCVDAKNSSYITQKKVDEQINSIQAYLDTSPSTGDYYLPWDEGGNGDNINLNPDSVREYYKLLLAILDEYTDVKNTKDNLTSAQLELLGTEMAIYEKYDVNYVIADRIRQVIGNDDTIGATIGMEVAASDTLKSVMVNLGIWSQDVTYDGNTGWVTPYGGKDYQKLKIETLLADLDLQIGALDWTKQSEAADLTAMKDALSIYNDGINDNTSAVDMFIMWYNTKNNVMEYAASKGIEITLTEVNNPKDDITTPPGGNQMILIVILAVVGVAVLGAYPAYRVIKRKGVRFGKPAEAGVDMQTYTGQTYTNSNDVYQEQQSFPQASEQQPTYQESQENYNNPSPPESYSPSQDSFASQPESYNPPAQEGNPGEEYTQSESVPGENVAPDMNPPTDVPPN